MNFVVLGNVLEVVLINSNSFLHILFKFGSYGSQIKYVTLKIFFKRTSNLF